MTIEDLYARGRANSLNLLRLILAALVILWHSYAVLGIHYPEAGLSMLLGNMPVNGFFAISGFLIYRSWVRRPRVWDYLVARVVRIYPGFWVCLAVTAFIVAPLGVALQGGDFWAQLWSGESFSYVWKNATLAMLQWTIGGTPSGVPFETSWDASLWTLAWEFLCYVFILALGVARLLTRPLALWLSFAVAVAFSLVTLIPGYYIEVLFRTGRFFGFFLAGALVAHYARVIRSSLWLGLLCVALAVASCWWSWGIILQLPATALGLVMVAGYFNPRWAELRNDLSYGVYIYAFPVQQLLVMSGLVSVGLVGFSLVAALLTIPLAALSWFIVEKPALKLRTRLGYPTWMPRRRVESI